MWNIFGNDSLCTILSQFQRLDLFVQVTFGRVALVIGLRCNELGRIFVVHKIDVDK